MKKICFILFFGTLLMPAFSAFAQTENEFVDLGLPSGTLWRESNEEGFFTFGQAMEEFGDNLPTKEQLEELMTLCTWVKAGDGFLVYGPNSRGIFFSAMGYVDCNGNTTSVGTSGYYWSSTLDESGAVWCLGFIGKYTVFDSFDQCYGSSVRLVQKKP